MRLWLLLMMLLPALAQAAVQETPISLQEQLELLLFPLGVIILTIGVVIWDRRRRRKH